VETCDHPDLLCASRLRSTGQLAGSRFRIRIAFQEGHQFDWRIYRDRGPCTGYIPSRVFCKPETVSVRISNAPTTDAVQAGYALWGVGRPYFSFDVLIEASQKPHSDYELTIMLPSDYLRQIPSNLKPSAFREVLHGSQSELHYYYEEVPTELDIKHGHLRVKVPKLSFYRLEQLYDTIIVGCVPR